MDKKIHITDVALRDGLQNIAHFVPTEQKIRLLNLLIDSGLRGLEVTSFVHPQAVPQFSDAEKVFSYALHHGGITVKALVPNLKGAQRAISSGADEIVFVFSASELHNQSNVNMSIRQSLDQLRDIVASIRQSNRSVRIQLSLATTFGYYGDSVPLERINLLTKEILELGVSKIVYCDSSGLAVPPDIEKLIHMIRGNHPEVQIGLHLHDTYGTALANCVAALQLGITSYESSVAGLGGCPFSVNASGNIATEDLVWAMEKMGFRTGINLDKLLEATSFIQQTIPGAHVVQSKLFGNKPSW